MLIEVCFKGNRKEFFLWEGEDPPAPKSHVIVEADRGEDLGHVHAVGELAQTRAKGCSHGPGETPISLFARRLATTEDLKRLRELREQDEAARKKAAERVRANGLAMKLTDAEWRWDRRKLTIYFTAEKRVDFRNLVRELASSFRTRIELKQIGVRDEAKRLSGIGRCGREYCSASWLPELRPVNLGVAKDQKLSLNPSQISGACGRLMCCLRYEHEFYVQQRKRFPKEGKVVTTVKGHEKVVVNDIFRERVTLRSEDGETRVLTLAELRFEMGSGERTLEVGIDDESPGSPVEGVSEEVIRLQDTVELPAWIPRSPDAPRPPAPSRQLPVAPAAASAPPRPERVEVPAPEDDAEDESDEGDDDAAPETSSASGDAEARPERRRRRRGRRGGRRNRGPDRGPGGGSGQPPDDGGGGGTS